MGERARIHYQLAENIDDLDEISRSARALILWHNLPLGADDLGRLKNCRAIIRNGVGCDSIDLQAAAASGIAVCNIPDYGTEEVADHTISLSLALCRQIFPLHNAAMRLEWKIPTPEKLRRLSTLHFGIIGLGPIGSATALRARNMGFQVGGYDPFVPKGMEKALGISRFSDLEALLGWVDVLSLHCPHNQHTHHMIADREFRLMKPGAFVVNTARGALIKKSDLLQALRENRLAGAALDVIEHEPLRTAEEAATPNLIVTCHAAFCSVESMRELRTSSAQIALAAVTGGKIENCLNPVPIENSGRP